MFQCAHSRTIFYLQFNIKYDFNLNIFGYVAGPLRFEAERMEYNGLNKRTGDGGRFIIFKLMLIG